MTSMSQNLYIDRLDEIVNKYNKTYHRTNIMKPVNVNLIMYIDFNIESNKKSLSCRSSKNIKI